MFRYFIKRLLIFIPTLLVISFLAFGISKLAPGDPVNCGNPVFAEKTYLNDYLAAELAYRERARQLGLDKPTFYFSFTSASHPDSLYKIIDRSKRKTLVAYLDRFGNWPLVDQYSKAIDALEIALFSIPEDQVKNEKIRIRQSLSQLKINYRDNRVQSELNNIENIVGKDSLLQEFIGSESNQLLDAFQSMKSNPDPIRRFVPAFRWYGFDNQYHNWFTNFIKGDFGISCRNGQPVVDRMKNALWWTLLLNILSIALAFLIAIPLGVFSAQKRFSAFDKWSTLILFFLYSLPAFWIATLLVVFFTTPEYGMQFFPPIGLGDTSADLPFWTRFWDRAAHLILPVFCLTYTNLAFIARQMRGGVLNVIRQDYIRTARAKGLSEQKVLWKHAFRNSLFPIITLIALIFPATISGSVIIEVIFNIPGMGRETFNAIFAQDWPVVFTVLMLTAILTLIGNLVADLLYAIADPRVSFKK